MAKPYKTVGHLWTVYFYDTGKYVFFDHKPAENQIKHWLKTTQDVPEHALDDTFKLGIHIERVDIFS